MKYIIKKNFIRNYEVIFTCSTCLQEIAYRNTLYIYVHKEKGNYKNRKYASTRVLVRKRRGQFASLHGILQRREDREQTFISMRLFPFSPVAVAKNRHRGSEGRICTLSRICTLPSFPKLLRTLFAVLARPEWRVNGGYLEAERHVHNERRTEMEKSEGKGSSQFPDPRIRSAPRNRSSLQNLRNCYATREAVIMRHQRKLWQSDRRSTHDSLWTHQADLGHQVHILAGYVGVVIARKDA